MTKYTAPAVLNAALAELATATRLTICSASPANFAGIAAVRLAEVTIDGSDFTQSNEGTGRKVTVQAQGPFPIDASVDDTATHVALHNGSVLLHVTEITPNRPLLDPGTVSTPDFNIAFGGPT